MSEKEKKRRAVYQKNREKWIFAQSVIVAVLPRDSPQHLRPGTFPNFVLSYPQMHLKSPKG